MLQSWENEGLGTEVTTSIPGHIHGCDGSEAVAFTKKECDEMNDHTLLSIQVTLDPRVHLTLNAQINWLPAITLMDSRAIGVFMHPSFAQACHAKIQSKVAPREVWIIDGKTIKFGLIIQEATIELCVGDHREIATANLINTNSYPCVLRTPSLYAMICHGHN